MDYLNGTIKSYLNSNLEDGNYVSAAGKDVIVLGGGDTGSDCVATSLRHGCNSITQFGTHDKAPLTRDPIANPWPQFPNVYTLDYAQQEAKAVFGEDPREFSIMTTKFVGDEEGNLKEPAHGADPPDGGRDRTEDLPAGSGTEAVYPAQLALIAIGFDGPEQDIIEQLKLDTDRRTNVKARYGKFNTNVDKVFAAGDMRRGQSLVVWAINEGREAAREVDKYLMGSTVLA